MMIRNLDHLNLNVHSLPDSIRFYGDLFGMTPVQSGADSDYGPWVILRGRRRHPLPVRTPRIPAEGRRRRARVAALRPAT